MFSTFNSVDYFVIFIFGLSIIMGFLRGLLREIVSLITWVAAAMVSSLFASKLASVFGGGAVNANSGAIENMASGNYVSLFALGISFVVLFIGTLFAGYILNIIIVGVIQGAYISLPNRLLGALFGAIRGFIVVVVLMFVAELTPMASQPAWAQSTLVKSFAPAVQWLQRVVQPGLNVLRTKAESAMQKIKENAPTSSSFQNLMKGQGGAESNP